MKRFGLIALLASLAGCSSMYSGHEAGNPASAGASAPEANVVSSDPNCPASYDFSCVPYNP